VSAQKPLTDFIIAMEICDSSVFIEGELSNSHFRTVGAFRNFGDSAVYLRKVGLRTYNQFVCTPSDSGYKVIFWELRKKGNVLKRNYITDWTINVVDSSLEIPRFRNRHFKNLKLINVFITKKGKIIDGSRLDSVPYMRVSIPWHDDYTIFKESQSSSILLDNSPVYFSSIHKEIWRDDYYILFSKDRKYYTMVSSKKMALMLGKRSRSNLIVEKVRDDILSDFILSRKP
jgi:hypothetical protein